MKRKLCLTAILLSACVTFSSCGNTADSSYGNYASESAAPEYYEDSAEDAYYDDGDYDYKDYGYEESESIAASDMGDSEVAVESSSDSAGGELTAEEDDSYKTATTGSDGSEVFDPTSKMVYTGNATVDTLDFDATMTAFQALLSENGGFIENENMTDGKDTYSYYYVEPTEKRRNYNAVARVPADKFRTMMDGLSELGDVRSSSVSTDNLSREYSDLAISLDIYQQTYDRYSALMETASDEDYILEIQDKLTQMQIQIEQTKSRMKRIDTDVTYSYLNIEIREVTKYNEAPPKTDTFLERLINTVKDTISVFLSFLEGFLFFIIRILPFAIFIGIIAGIVLFIVKKTEPGRERKKAEKRARKEEMLNRARESRAQEAAQQQSEKKDDTPDQKA
ncbi:MAG: DUF4349 domain-containing protein [Lachnospiraceae bacterium]|nr:DUF4349 domain-containing protein [Lachnospiraceae bacterium]